MILIREIITVINILIYIIYISKSKWKSTFENARNGISIVDNVQISWTGQVKSEVGGRETVGT